MRTMRRKRYRCSALAHQGKGYNIWNLQFWLVLKWIIIDVFKWWSSHSITNDDFNLSKCIPFTCMLMSKAVLGSTKASLTNVTIRSKGPFTLSANHVSSMSLAILLRLIAYKFLNTPRELLWNGLQCQIEPERQRGRSVDADAQCKWTLIQMIL